MNILIIPGSLREKSYNKCIARYLEELQLNDVKVEIFYLNNFPMFNEDLEKELPKEVSELIVKVNWADSFVMVTPEYNNSLPAITRNALHWLSRKYSKKYILDKPLGIVGVSDGGFGTVRAQNELLLMATIIGFKVNSHYRLPISNALELFSESNVLIDEKTKQRLTTYFNEFVMWTKETQNKI